MVALRNDDTLLGKLLQEGFRAAQAGAQGFGECKQVAGGVVCEIVGAPVFLTKNGRGRYAIVDMQDYERTQATIRLMNELAKGRHSGETEGWLTPDDMRTHFRARANEE